MVEAWAWYSLLYLCVGVVVLERSDRHLPTSMKDGLSMARFWVIILWGPVIIGVVLRGTFRWVTRTERDG